HAYNRHGEVADGRARAGDRFAPAELPSPQALTDDRRRRAASTLFLRSEKTAADGRDAHDRKEIARDDRHVRAHGLAIHDHGHLAAAADLRERGEAATL